MSNIYDRVHWYSNNILCKDCVKTKRLDACYPGGGGRAVCSCCDDQVYLVTEDKYPLDGTCRYSMAYLYDVGVTWEPMSCF